MTVVGDLANNATVVAKKKETVSMAIPHAAPGEIVDVRPLGTVLDSTPTTTLVRAFDVEEIRLDMRRWQSAVFAITGAT